LDDAGLSACRNRRVGFIFQFASLLPILTVRENVMLAALFGEKRCRRQERATMILITHNLALAKTVPRMLRMKQGRLDLVALKA